MEKVALNNLQLDYLARSQYPLNQHFYGTVPCDGLPSTVSRDPTAYIVNTDPEGEPGRHWLAIWTNGNVCEVLDSYGVPLDVYQTAEPIKNWIDRHFKYQLSNDNQMQSVFSESCGDYALMFLVARSEGVSMTDFLKRFNAKDFVTNDHIVGEWLKNLVIDKIKWREICNEPHEQDTYITKCIGIRDCIWKYDMQH